MALPVKMNDDERGIMTFHGLTGGIIATLLLLSILAALTYGAIVTQTANAEKYYTVNQDLHAIKAGSTFSDDGQKDGKDNYKMWINK